MTLLIDGYDEGNAVKPPQLWMTEEGTLACVGAYRPYRPYIWMGEDQDAHVKEWNRQRCAYCQSHHDSRIDCRPQIARNTAIINIEPNDPDARIGNVRIENVVFDRKLSETHNKTAFGAMIETHLMAMKPMKQRLSKPLLAQLTKQRRLSGFKK